jgi:hypothetical protein
MWRRSVSRASQFRSGDAEEKNALFVRHSPDSDQPIRWIRTSSN